LNAEGYPSSSAAPALNLFAKIFRAFNNHDMIPRRNSHLDQKVSRNWRLVAALADRKPGMAWSDRLWYWLVSLGGLAIVAVGVCVIAFLHIAEGGLMIGWGLAVFILGWPSQAARNGYREL
jgi:hypothetical protein